MYSIKILNPEENSVTPPLQKYKYPGRVRLIRPGDGEKDEEPRAVCIDTTRNAISQDRSIPREVLFRWRVEGGVPAGFSFKVAVSRDRVLSNPDFELNLRKTSFRLSGLQIGTGYFWRVSGKGAKGESAFSRTAYFKTSGVPPRWIHVPGVTNVRDMGGWRLNDGRRIRQGMAYRGSEMNAHVNLSPEAERVLLNDMKIKTDIDLRGEGFASPALNARRVDWIHIPVYSYASLVKDNWPRNYARVLRLFADPGNYPLIFHCRGGVDRGGTAAFLLHALLGLGMNELAWDYELSSFAIWGRKSRKSRVFRELVAALQPFGGKDDSINVKVENYFKMNGLTAARIGKIREILIED